jgi:hypothetical protein
MKRATLFILVISSVSLVALLINWKFIDSTKSEQQIIQELSNDNQLLSNQVQNLKDQLKSKEEELQKGSNTYPASKKSEESKKEIVFKNKLNEYTIIHKKILSGELPPRFCQCVLLNGWGNVLQVLLIKLLL